MWTCFYAFMSSPHPPLLSEPLGTLVNCLLPHCQEKAAICIISCTYSVRQTSLGTICVLIYLRPFKEESVPDVEVSIHWKSVHEKTKEPGSEQDWCLRSYFERKQIPKILFWSIFFLWIFSVRFLIGGKLYQFREKRAGSTPWASENTHLLNQLSIKGKWCFPSKVNGNMFLMKNVRSSFKNSLCKVFFLWKINYPCHIFKTHVASWHLKEVIL